MGVLHRVSNAKKPEAPVDARGHGIFAVAVHGNDGHDTVATQRQRKRKNINEIGKSARFALACMLGSD